MPGSVRFVTLNLRPIPGRYELSALLSIVKRRTTFDVLTSETAGGRGAPAVLSWNGDSQAACELLSPCPTQTETGAVNETDFVIAPEERF